MKKALIVAVLLFVGLVGFNQSNEIKKEETNKVKFYYDFGVDYQYFNVGEVGFGSSFSVIPNFGISFNRFSLSVGLGFGKHDYNNSLIINRNHFNTVEVKMNYYFKNKTYMFLKLSDDDKKVFYDVSINGLSQSVYKWKVTAGYGFMFQIQNFNLGTNFYLGVEKNEFDHNNINGTLRELHPIVMGVNITLSNI